MSIRKFDTILEKRSKAESDLYLALEKMANEANADFVRTDIKWFDDDKLDEVPEDFVAYFSLCLKRVK